MPRNLKLDHATICGSDLGSLRHAFADAGLPTDYGGPHANGLTHMAQLGFPDGSYLELIAPLKPGLTEGAHWSGMMAENAGCCAWAVTVPDIRAETARLNAIKIEPPGPFPGSRKRPDGKVLQWEIAPVGPGEPGALLPFMIQDHTPRDWRAPMPASLNDLRLSGVAAVVLGVKNLSAAGEMIRRAYGWGAPAVEEHEDFGRVAYFGGTPVILAAPLQADSWLAKRLQKFGERPAAFLLGATNLGDAAQRFKLCPFGKWFGREMAWFEVEDLSNLKLGVIAG